MKVLVLTSGGDAPGMNKVIGTLYKKFKGKLYACRAGYRGLINNDIVSMKEFKPLDFINQSGSVIKCSRCDAFKEEGKFNHALENAKRFDVVVVIGGNGSLKGAERLTEAGVKTIFIPATIDNDIEGSEYSLGYHTAIKAGVETYRNIMPSFDAHERCLVMEVMGNKCDNLLKAISKICQPTFQIASLKELAYDDIAKELLLNKEKGEPSSIIIKDNIIKLDELVEKLSKLTPNIEVRGIQVGYLQRGFKPTDRELSMAKAFAKQAIKAVNGEKSVKLFVNNGKVKLIDM